MTEQTTTIDVPATCPGDNATPKQHEGRFEALLSRIDLVAIVITIVGVCLLAVAATVLATIGVAKLISSMWSIPLDRGLMILLCSAIVWVTVRWKRSRLS